MADNLYFPEVQSDNRGRLHFPYPPLMITSAKSLRYFQEISSGVGRISITSSGSWMDVVIMGRPSSFTISEQWRLSGSLYLPSSFVFE